MYSICEFAALISEEQNWRKLIYEKRIAYVAICCSIGSHRAECSAKQQHTRDRKCRFPKRAVPVPGLHAPGPVQLKQCFWFQSAGELI